MKEKNEKRNQDYLMKKGGRKETGEGRKRRRRTESKLMKREGSKDKKGRNREKRMKKKISSGGTKIMR